MADNAYYRPDLAWVHHVGYAQYVENTSPGILHRLQAGHLPPRAQVLDVGCGSGLLARKLTGAGFTVHGIDASHAMIDIARGHSPGARFEVISLPTRKATGADGSLPLADAVVSTGHVLNYLDSRDDVALALGELARAVRAGGLLVIDLMTERFAQVREVSAVHGKVEDDWAIITRFSRPAPFRFDRQITVFRRDGDLWRRSDEHHRNVTFEAHDALQILADNGIEAHADAAFGGESLPEGLIVLAGSRR